MADKERLKYLAVFGSFIVPFVLGMLVLVIDSYLLESKHSYYLSSVSNFLIIIGFLFGFIAAAYLTLDKILSPDKLKRHQLSDEEIEIIMDIKKQAFVFKMRQLDQLLKRNNIEEKKK